MARVSEAKASTYLGKLRILKGLGSLEGFETVAYDSLHDLKDARSVLHELLARMEDHYDGAPDAKPSLPFNGNDMEEIKQVLG